MDFFDFIKELRKGEPDIGKAQKAMKILGWICTVGALWNFIIYFIGPFKGSPFNLPPEYPYLALISLLFLGALFFRSSRGIREMEPWGKKTGQIAIVLLIVVFIGFMFFVFPMKAVPLNDNTFSIVFLLFAGVFVAQFALPAYFGVRYLSRLPVKGEYTGVRYQSENISTRLENRINRESAMPQVNYKEALFPFGIIGTFAIIIGIFLFTMFVSEKYAGPDFMAGFVLWDLE